MQIGIHQSFPYNVSIRKLLTTVDTSPICNPFIDKKEKQTPQIQNIVRR